MTNAMLWRNSTECSERTHGRLPSQSEILGKFEFELKCLSWEIKKKGKYIPEKKKSMCNVPKKRSDVGNASHSWIEKEFLGGVLLKSNRSKVEPGIFIANKFPGDTFGPQITFWVSREEHSRNWMTFSVFGPQRVREKWGRSHITL